jgi:hypothetical protein
VSRILVASFGSDADLRTAVQRVRRTPLGPVETYSPCPSEGETRGSPLPLAILLAGLIGAGGGYLLEVYADTLSYPMDIGGRPNFSWPSFVPIAFELGVLAAVATGFIGFLLVNRMPRLYDPIDVAESFAEASRAQWLLVLRPQDDAATVQARALIHELPVLTLEELVT